MGQQTTGSYLPEEIENIIVEALDFYATSDISPANKEQRHLADEFSHALQNDTWLLQTTEFPAVENCKMGLHSWVDQVGKLPPGTKCAHCPETYGNPS